MFEPLLSVLTSNEMVILTLVLAAVSLLILPIRDHDHAASEEAWRALSRRALSALPRWQPENDDLQPLPSDALLPHPYSDGPQSRLCLPAQRSEGPELWPLLGHPRPLHRVAKAS